MRTRSFIFMLGLACGPSAHAPAKQAATKQVASDTWSKLSFEDRHSVMTFKVLPNMARTWRDWKKTEYPEMTCRTCHGKDAESANYKMPNASLPPINAAHPPVGPAADFMKTRVVPEMIDLLDAKPEHVTCNTCHPKS